MHIYSKSVMVLVIKYGMQFTIIQKIYTGKLQKTLYAIFVIQSIKVLRTVIQSLLLKILEFTKSYKHFI